jgi:hypothetical protein
MHKPTRLIDARHARAGKAARIEPGAEIKHRDKQTQSAHPVRTIPARNRVTWPRPSTKQVVTATPYLCKCRSARLEGCTASMSDQERRPTELELPVPNGPLAGCHLVHPLCYPCSPSEKRIVAGDECQASAKPPSEPWPGCQSHQPGRTAWPCVVCACAWQCGERSSHPLCERAG